MEDPFQVLLADSQAIKVQGHRRLIEDSEHHGLAVSAGNDGDADVGLGFSYFFKRLFEFDGETAVFHPSPNVGLESAEEFDFPQKRRVFVQWDRSRGLEDPVHPETDFDSVLFRLDMDVPDAQKKRSAENEPGYLLLVGFGDEFGEFFQRRYVFRDGFHVILHDQDRSGKRLLHQFLIYLLQKIRLSGGAPNLFHGGYAFDGLKDPVLRHGDHAVLDSGLGDFPLPTHFQNQLLDRFGDREHFENSDPSLITQVVAFRTALGPVQRMHVLRDFHPGFRGDDC